MINEGMNCSALSVKNSIIFASYVQSGAYILSVTNTLQIQTIMYNKNDPSSLIKQCLDNVHTMSIQSKNINSNQCILR